RSARPGSTSAAHRDAALRRTGYRSRRSERRRADLPAFPVDTLLQWAAALRHPAGLRGPLAVVGGPPDGDAAAGLDVVGQSELPTELGLVLDGHAEEARRVALVDRREQDEHRGG